MRDRSAFFLAAALGAGALSLVYGLRRSEESRHAASRHEVEQITGEDAPYLADFPAPENQLEVGRESSRFFDNSPARAQLLEAEVARLRAQLDGMRKLALDTNTRDAVSMELGITAREVEDQIAFSLLLDSQADLRLLVASTGTAAKAWSVLLEEQTYLQAITDAQANGEREMFVSSTIDATCRTLLEHGAPAELVDRFRQQITKANGP